MAKHPTSSRVHRDPDGPDDAFVDSVQRTADWARAHSRQLTIAGILLAVLVIGGVYYVNSQRQLEAEAATQFTQVQQSVASGNTQLAIRDLQNYLNTFGGTEASRPARLILADLLLSQDQPAEAADALGNLANDLEEPFGLAGARLLAAAREEMGQVDQAVAIYRRIAENARFSYQRREALADAARVRLQNGDADAAAALYQEVVGTFGEQETGRGYYEMWLAEAQAQAQEGSGAAPVVADTADSDTAESQDTTGA